MEDGPELPEPPLEAAELDVELVVEDEFMRPLAELFCSSANLTFRTVVAFPWWAFPFPWDCDVIC